VAGFARPPGPRRGLAPADDGAPAAGRDGPGGRADARRAHREPGAAQQTGRALHRADHAGIHRAGPMSPPAVSHADTTAGPGTGPGAGTEAWRDPLRPAAERVADLLARMTLEEKGAQLTSIWPRDQPRDSNVAPMQGDFHDPEGPFAELVRDGLGQLTRVFGTRPV